MNFQYLKQNLLVVFALFLLLFSACTKIITTDIGSNLLPPSDGVTTKDTFITVYAKNAGDSAIFLNTGDDHVVGYLNDPLLGQTAAQINVQLVPPYFPFSFPVNKDSITADSVVLELHFDGVWGDSTLPLSLRVFRIASDQPFTVDSVYKTSSFIDNDEELTYNNTPVAISPIGLITDSFHAFADSGVSTIRIRLNDALAQQFLNQFDATNAYVSDSLFNIYFRGFQIASTATGNSLFKINLTDPGTKLALYFKYLNPDSTGVTDTAVRYFTAAAGVSAHSNYITRNRSGSQLSNYYPSANSQDSLLFIEANPGNFANISIPGLTGFRNVLIHRAELLMEQIPDNSDLYFTPPVLMLAGYDADSMRREALLSDLTDVNGNISLATFGSFPISTYDNGRIDYSYNLNISRYVQGIITRNDTNYHQLALYAPFYTEYLYSSQAAITPFTYSSVPINNPACGRVRLGGGNIADTSKRMRLHIVYSLLH